MEDLRPVYDAADLFVSPFRESYGLKMKALHAFSMGMCVVALPAGIRGIPVVNERHAIVARDDDDFVAQLIRLARDRDTRERIATEARKYAVQQWDWSHVGERLRGLLKDALLEVQWC